MGGGGSLAASVKGNMQVESKGSSYFQGKWWGQDLNKKIGRGRSTVSSAPWDTTPQKTDNRLGAQK